LRLGRHRLDITSGAGLAPDRQPPFDDGGVGYETAFQAHHVVRAAEGVLPGTVVETGSEGGVEETPKIVQPGAVESG
jgi:hypothetical protein